MSGDYTDFAEVFDLSNEGLTPSRVGDVSAAYSLSTISEFNSIDIDSVLREYSLKARNFVDSINKFVIDFNDDGLTEEHRQYLESVAELQTNDLIDLLALVDVNKKMILNIVNQVNAVRFEDLMLINSYNSLITQHIKLIKELQTLYRSIPSTMKKMLADVRCDQQLVDGGVGAEVMTEDFGVTQFNNQKQLLQSLIDKHRGGGENNMKNKQ